HAPGPGRRGRALGEGGERSRVRPRRDIEVAARGARRVSCAALRVLRRRRHRAHGGGAAPGPALRDPGLWHQRGCAAPGHGELRGLPGRGLALSRLQSRSARSCAARPAVCYGWATQQPASTAHRSTLAPGAPMTALVVANPTNATEIK